MACADWLDASCELVFGRLIHAYRSNKTQRTPMAGRRRFVVPAGWVARGFRFEVEPTSPEQRSRIAQQFGGRRFAHNWALAQVKANLDACQADPGILLLAWNAYRLRKQWNQAKHQVAPWWRACSKEAYASGIADLVQGAAQLVGRQARPSDRTAGRVPQVQGPPPRPWPGALHHWGNAPGARPPPPRVASGRAAALQGEYPAATAAGPQGPGTNPVDDPVRARPAGGPAGGVGAGDRLPSARHPQRAGRPLWDRPGDRAGVGGHRPQ
jgi:hypothetical protein